MNAKRKLLSATWLGCALLGLGSAAQARVFNLNEERLAGYFTVSGGTSSVGQEAFLNEADTTTTYDKKVGSMYTGEFGLLYSTPSISMRFGFEVFEPQALKTVTATDNGSATYTLNSAFTIYAPKVGIEFNVHKTNTYRSFLFGYYGNASVSYKNDYTIISYPGVSNHSVQAKGSTALYGGGLAVESLLSDATTFVFELGYRQMEVQSLSYSQAVTTFTGAQVAGNPVLDASGNTRKLNFSGPYLSFGFRFYL